MRVEFFRRYTEDLGRDNSNYTTTKEVYQLLRVGHVRFGLFRKILHWEDPNNHRLKPTTTTFIDRS